MWTAAVQPIVIAVLVVLEVAVWQVRVALATRGQKRSAAMLGAVNAVLTVGAIGQVVTNLDRPANIAGYAIGVAVGVYLGVVADARFAGDPVEYRLVLPGEATDSAVDVAQDLQTRGWLVTMQPASGPNGPATVLTVVARANRAAQLERDLAELTPAASCTSIRLRSAVRTSLPPRPLVTTAGTHPLQKAKPGGTQ